MIEISQNSETFWKFLQHRLTSGNYLVYPAIPENLVEIPMRNNQVGNMSAKFCTYGTFNENLRYTVLVRTFANCKFGAVQKVKTRANIAYIQSYFEILKHAPVVATI